MVSTKDMREAECLCVSKDVSANQNNAAGMINISQSLNKFFWFCFLATIKATNGCCAHTSKSHRRFLGAQ